MDTQQPPEGSAPEDKTASVKEGVDLIVPVIEIEEKDDQEQPAATSCLPIHESSHHHHHHHHGHKHDHECDKDICNGEESDTEQSGSSDESWEDSSSLMEAAFEQLEDSHVPHSGDQALPDECSKSESKAYQRLLRQVGVEEFIKQTIENESVSARKLCTAFGLRVPFLEGGPDDAYYRILGLAIQREMQKRVKLEEWNTLDDAVRLLQNASNIIVVTGAGISTSLGIPDFRSKHNGLYARLEHLGLSDPQEVFDIALFRDDPTIFYSVAKDILPETKRFTPTHGFIKMLQDRGQLLVNYTQNIDNIEGYAGIEGDKLIQCHGSFATATCQRCGHKVNGDEIHDDIKAGKIPRCGACILKSQQIRPTALKRKRSTDHKRNKSRQREDSDSSSEADVAEEIGIMKPDITFFGENLPDTFHDRLRNTDYSTVDLVIVIGTSLKVAPVAEIPNFVSGQSASIPQIYISRDPCQHIAFDIELLGECDVVIAELCRRAGWKLEHEMAVRPEQSIAIEQAREAWQWNVFVKEDEVSIAEEKGISSEI